MSKALDWRVYHHKNRKGETEYYYAAKDDNGKVKYGSGPYGSEKAAKDSMNSQRDKVKGQS